MKTLEQRQTLSRDLIQAFDNVNGVHPGFRPAHAKGILLAGTFTPAAGGADLTRAPHLHRASTPVSVRFSDFAGIPTIPDNNENASPRGMATRFHLAEHVHTDIVAHSVDGFPVATAEEFLGFLRAIYESGDGAKEPSPIQQYLASHPAALEFVQTPKPFPVSFAKESFFAVNAYQFLNQRGVTRYGRYRVRPEGGGGYLPAADAAAKSGNYLFDEIAERLQKGPARFHVFVQLASTGDIVDNSTIHWPEEREQIEFGTIELDSVVANNADEQRRIIFDPIPRVDGIDSSQDPLLEPRADVYLMAGRRRRAGGATTASAS